MTVSRLPCKAWRALNWRTIKSTLPSVWVRHGALCIQNSKKQSDRSWWASWQSGCSRIDTWRRVPMSSFTTVTWVITRWIVVLFYEAWFRMRFSARLWSGTCIWRCRSRQQEREHRPLRVPQGWTQQFWYSHVVFVENNPFIWDLGRRRLLYARRIWPASWGHGWVCQQRDRWRHTHYVERWIWLWAGCLYLLHVPSQRRQGSTRIASVQVITWLCWVVQYFAHGGPHELL